MLFSWRRFMETAKQETIKAVENHIETELYMFAPSISKRRTLGDKTYFVRSYFAGGKDFEKAMERIATKQAIQRKAG